MASFAELTANLNLNIQGFASNLKQASSLMASFAKDMNGKINDGLTKPAKNSYNVFTDIKRIVQGILISQAFYQGLRVIKEANAAVWEFARSLEYAEIAYSNLFKDQALAKEFINVLKDFAAVTPYGFTEAEKAARRLLSYGIEYKNVMYVLQGIMSASTMTGDPQTMESVSRALGQIQTKGRLYNEEMRQLAEAGIPAYEILQEKLGLTSEQLRRLSKEAIPAHVAINALVDGMNERFGGVANVANLTMKGLIANLKDNALMIGSEIIAPLFDKFKAILVPIVEFVTELRDIVDKKGLGGLFERLIPPEMQATVRQFIANLMNLWQVVKLLLTVAFQAFGVVLRVIIQLFNTLGPVIIAVIDVVARIIKAILDNEKAVKFLTGALAAAAAMWVIFKVKALASAVVAGVITLISKAIAGLSTVMTWIVAHPFWSLMMGLVGLVVGLSGGFSKLGQSINGFFKSLTKFNGIDPDKVLMPSQKERADDLAKFNERLQGTGDAMDSLADKTGKATKAAKGLLSFDEVFKLNQPDEGAGGGGAIDWGDWDIGDFGGFGDSLIPEIPDFSGFAKDFVDNLLEALGGKEQAVSFGIGALLGAAIGGLLGGPGGALIGASIGAFVGWFWPEFARLIGLSDTQKIAIPISVGIGAAIGAVAGGPMGAAIGGAIGALVGWIIGKIQLGLDTGDWEGLGAAIGLGVGAALGFAIGGPGGAAIGAGIGLLTGWVTDKIVAGFTTGEWDVGGIAQGLGPLIGAGIGAIVGGPAGAAIGAAIGALVGWIVDLIADNWPAISAWFVKAWDDITAWFKQAWLDVKEWLATAWENISGWFKQAWEDIVNWLTTAWSDIGEWFSNLWETISNFFTDVWDGFFTWISNIWDSFTTWISNVWDSVTTWLSNLFTKIGQFFSDIWTSITTWFSDLFKKISTFFSDIWTGITTFFSNVWGKFTGFFSDIWTSVKEGVANIYNTFKNWISDLWNNVFGKFFGWISDGIQKLKEFFGLDKKAKATDTSYADGPDAVSGASGYGHARGGIFNREHVARFAEGNKAEAIIPLENAEAMRPFVDAISTGIMQGMMPSMVALANNASAADSAEALRPLYVGTLIADERSLKELQRKMNVIQLQESGRRG